MKEYQSLSHTRWDCKYHVVFIPKRRKKRVFGVLRQHLGEMFHELASHKEAKIVEGHLMGDHVHICISIPPKYAVSNVVGYLNPTLTPPSNTPLGKPHGARHSAAMPKSVCI